MYAIVCENVRKSVRVSDNVTVCDTVCSKQCSCRRLPAAELSSNQYGQWLTRNKTE